MTETALAELLAADLTELDLVAIMVDGVHFADHLCVVAPGIDITGVKHPLAPDLRERGLEVTRPILAVLDGSKALRRAVLEVFDHPVIARCQLHYADVRVMPMWSTFWPRGGEFALLRSA